MIYCTYKKNCDYKQYIKLLPVDWNIFICLLFSLCTVSSIQWNKQHNTINNGNRKFSHREFIIHSMATQNTTHITIYIVNTQHSCWWAFFLALFALYDTFNVWNRFLEICNDHLSFSNGSFVLVFLCFSAFVFFIFDHIRSTRICWVAATDLSVNVNL